MSAGTKGAEDCNDSGKAKLANANENNENGIDVAEIIGDGHIPSSKREKNVQDHARKHSDSYKLLIGKCDDSNHLIQSWEAMVKLVKPTIRRTKLEFFSLPNFQREKGKQNNNKQKANNPNKKTGSVWIWNW